MIKIKPDHVGRGFLVTFGGWLGMPWILGGTIVLAQVTPAPQTLPLDSVVDVQPQPNGNLYRIGGGSAAGANLFHSLDTFSLGAQDQAVFEHGAGIERIITRVVGSEGSFLDGTITTQSLGLPGPSPVDLFLLNPRGVILGPNAVLNLGGSFVASSADRLLFQDGQYFSSTPTGTTPLLSVSVPVGLQFGSPDPSPNITVTIEGDTLSWRDGFTNAPRPIFHLIAPTITLTDLFINWPGAQVTVQALESLQVDNLNNLALSGSFNSSAFQTLTLASRGTTSVANSLVAVQENLTIQADDRLSLSNSYLDSGFVPLESSRTRTGDIILSSAGDLLLNRRLDGEVVNNGPVIFLTSGDRGLDVGEIRLSSGQDLLANATLIIGTNSSARFDQGGSSGQITLEAQGNILLAEGSFATSDTFANNPAGRIRLEAQGTITLDSLSSLSSTTFSGGSAASIEVNAGQGILITGNSLISSNSSGSGPAGNINLSTNGSISLTDGSTLAASTFDRGNAGNITLQATGSIALDESYIQSLTSSLGNGGEIQLIAGDRISLITGSTSSTAATFLATGASGNITLTGGNAIVLQGQTQDSSPLAAASTSPIYLELEPPGVSQNSPQRGSQSPLGFAETITPFFFQASTDEDYAQVFRARDFPFVSIQGSLNAADSLDMYRVEIPQAGTQMIFDIDNTDPALDTYIFVANSANLVLAANRDTPNSILDVGSAQGQDSSLSFIFPGVGTYVVGVQNYTPGQVSRVDDRFTPYTLNISRIAPASAQTRISTQTASSQPAGNLSLQAPQIEIWDGASLEVNSSGSGPGGILEIQANTLQLENQAAITADTTSNQGGNITLTLGQWLSLHNGSTISTEAGTARLGGDGGDITIVSPLVLGLPGTTNRIIANAFQGNGGNISITTRSILGPQFLDISASSALGVDGTININASIADPGAGLVALDSELLDLAGQIAAVCGGPNGATSQQRSNRFVVIGREGLPTRLEELLEPEPLLEDWRLTATPPSPVIPPQPLGATPPRPREVQGWIHNAQGQVQLVTMNQNDYLPTIAPTCTHPSAITSPRP